MITQTKETQAELTPKDILTSLQEGNQRFISNNQIKREYSEQIGITSGGQYPYAVVLSCIDSRVPVEVVFDQGIGDIFSARVAGNVIDEDMLGSIEYACAAAGSKLILVLGHTKCGAVTSACKGVEMGNVTALLSKIKPAVDTVIQKGDEITSEKIEEVVVKNVQLSMDRIKKESQILKDLIDNGTVDLVGGIYDVATGKVNII